ncbi:hypothetical protein B0H13DRAFT_1929611 [Mycena leptocephala]|nr:hypothetical protein B0H13DRAFT_1929611 [Mycena leptocephala]
MSYPPPDPPIAQPLARARPSPRPLKRARACPQRRAHLAIGTPPPLGSLWSCLHSCQPTRSLSRSALSAKAAALRRFITPTSGSRFAPTPTTWHRHRPRHPTPDTHTPARAVLRAPCSTSSRPRGDGGEGEELASLTLAAGLACGARIARATQRQRQRGRGELRVVVVVLSGVDVFVGGFLLSSPSFVAQHNHPVPAPPNPAEITGDLKLPNSPLIHLARHCGALGWGGEAAGVDGRNFALGGGRRRECVRRDSEAKAPSTRVMQRRGACGHDMFDSVNRTGKPGQLGKLVCDRAEGGYKPARVATKASRPTDAGILMQCSRLTRLPRLIDENLGKRGNNPLTQRSNNGSQQHLAATPVILNRQRRHPEAPQRRAIRQQSRTQPISCKAKACTANAAAAERAHP